MESITIDYLTIFDGDKLVHGGNHVCYFRFADTDNVLFLKHKETIFDSLESYSGKMVLLSGASGFFLTDLGEDEVSSILDKYVDILRDIGLHFNILYFMQKEDITFVDFFAKVNFLLNRAKKNEIHYETIEDRTELKKHLYIISQLEDIAAKGDLMDERVLVYCQPVMNVRTRQYDTAEALMRLKLPELDMIYPDTFIPVAEEYGYIHALSLIIFNKVCHAVRKFQDEGYHVNRISVNFSVQEFRKNNFTNELRTIIAKNKVSSKNIAVEVTESENDEEFYLVEKIISDLSDMNIHLYLDDFGTGYSNFDRLFHLKLNVIKFDRSFLLMAETNEKTKFLIQYFSAAFNKMGYEVLYEGVETDEQEELCINSKADYLQGYRYSRPIPIMELTRFLAKERDYERSEEIEKSYIRRD